MATTHIDHQVVPITGVAPTYVAIDTANGSDFYPSAGRLVLLRNSGGSSVTVTFVTPGTVQGLAIADLTVSVPAGQSRAVALGEAAAFRDPNGVVVMTASAACDAAILHA